MAEQMPHPGHDTEEIARCGEELYERSIRERVEPEHVGRFLALDVSSGDYEVTDEVLSPPTVHKRVAAYFMSRFAGSPWS